MEGDYHVGQILDTLKDLGVDDDTILVFASDNGPQGRRHRELGNQGTPDMGIAGPFRGELAKPPRARSGHSRSSAGQATSNRTPPRTPCSRSWTSSRRSPASSVARCRLTGRLTASIRPTCCSERVRWASRELLTFIGADLVAARWKQWRMYFTDMHPTGIGPQRLPGPSANVPDGGYPKVYNIEMDPHEDLNVAALFGWAADPALDRSGNTWSRSRSIQIRPRRTSLYLVEAVDRRGIGRRIRQARQAPDAACGHHLRR